MEAGHADFDAVRQKPPPTRMVVTHDADDPELIAEQKAAEAEAAKQKKTKWPPKTGPDVYRRWAVEVQRRHPKWKKPRLQSASWGKVGALGKKLLQRFEPDDLLAVMRVAIWDWEAIRGDKKFYADKPVPELGEIVRFAEQLAACAEEGWTDHKHRVSAYVCEFVEKVDAEDVIDMSAVASATKGRRRA